MQDSSSASETSIFLACQYVQNAKYNKLTVCVQGLHKVWFIINFNYLVCLQTYLQKRFDLQRSNLLSVLVMSSATCIYGKIIFIHKKIVRFNDIPYNLKSTKSCTHEHIHRPQTTKCRAHGIKWFYSSQFVYFSNKLLAWSHTCTMTAKLLI